MTTCHRWTPRSSIWRSRMTQYSHRSTEILRCCPLTPKSKCFKTRTMERIHRERGGCPSISMQRCQGGSWVSSRIALKGCWALIRWGRRSLSLMRFLRLSTKSRQVRRNWGNRTVRAFCSRSSSRFKRRFKRKSLKNWGPWKLRKTQMI